MLLGGLQKTTLIDFPGRLGCTVFTVGCNFRCPFCHNKDLVSLKNFRKSGLEEISESSFFEFLEKRKKILDGVCITGGEPTIQSDLANFCKKIKALGLEVKVDTNGSSPRIIEKLIKAKLVDFIAMDIKTTFKDYAQLVNFQFSIFNFQKSIKVVLQSGIEYELRTTVVPGIHDKKKMIKLAQDIKNLILGIKYQRLKLNWILQQFQAKNCLDPKYLKVKPYSSQELENILKSVKTILPKTTIRGAD